MASDVATLIDGRGGLGNFHQLGPREPTEHERFAAEWPTTAAAVFPLIGVKLEPEAPRRFPAGKTFYPKTVDRFSLPAEFWRDLVDRHTRNDDAAHEGSLVRSVFPLSDADNARWPKVQSRPDRPPDDPPPRIATVVTQFGRDNITVATVDAVVPQAVPWDAPMTNYYAR
jgi:hypothetical protein